MLAHLQIDYCLLANYLSTTRSQGHNFFFHHLCTQNMLIIFVYILSPPPTKKKNKKILKGTYSCIYLRSLPAKSLQSCPQMQTRTAWRHHRRKNTHWSPLMNGHLEYEPFRQHTDESLHFSSKELVARFSLSYRYRMLAHCILYPYLQRREKYTRIINYDNIGIGATCCVPIVKMFTLKF